MRLDAFNVYFWVNFCVDTFLLEGNSGTENRLLGRRNINSS